MKSGIQPILSRDIDNELQAHEARDTWVFRSYGGAIIFVIPSIKSVLIHPISPIRCEKCSFRSASSIVLPTERPVLYRGPDSMGIKYCGSSSFSVIQSFSRGLICITSPAQ